MIDHVGIRVRDLARSAAFYRQALRPLGYEADAPRVWPEYHPTYYGAFVTDPDGYNVEAVCHTPG